MAGRILALSARNVKVRTVPLGAAAAHGHAPSYQDTVKELIGNREIVGFGTNGNPNYIDRSDIPMPAIRWKETTPDITALREKEKGDWKQLSVEEKKQLYRSTFRQTFSEFKAPTGQWKSTVGLGLFFCSMGLWLVIAMKIWIYSPLPDSFSEEKQKAQLRRMLDSHVNPILGISSKWDYENNKWK